MAFWGIEVKPGKPYTHSSKDSKGRLRISQATLATGSATIKSLVQCNVGDKSPVLLCALLPDKTESLQLDLEFDEADDVIFSVIGPRGVFLTGYYANHGRYSTMQDDTESFGEDIANSVESIRNSDEDEDEYEDSFINDDEPEVLTASESSSKDDDDEDYDDDEYLKKKKKKTDVKGGLKRLKKKCQIVESDDDEVNFIEIDDETPIASIRKVNKSATIEKKTKKETVNGETESKVDEPNEVSESKSKSKKKKRGSSKEKRDTVASSVNESNGLKGDKINQNEVDDNTVPEAVVNEGNPETPVNEAKTKKKKKEKKVNAVKADDANHIDDEKSKDMAVTPEETKKKKRKTRGNSLEVITNQQPIENGNNSDEKKIKKKKRRTSKTPEIDENTNMEVEKENKSECNKKTLSNGLVIEDLVSGKSTSKAKVAAPGKKVKVQYVVKLKENGQVVDSNGESPYKFRLGDKQVIEGLNVGIEGMKVGDKRRLTIPPSMSLGYKGTGENIPPNSWLVYDVEVCSVH